MKKRKFGIIKTVHVTDKNGIKKKLKVNFIKRTMDINAARIFIKKMYKAAHVYFNYESED
jgi:hypothetical protein